MNALINYLIEASISLLLFYGAYWLFLRKETDFHFNRLFLIIPISISDRFRCISTHPFSNATKCLPTLSGRLDASILVTGSGGWQYSSSRSKPRNHMGDPVPCVRGGGYHTACTIDAAADWFIEVY